MLFAVILLLIPMVLGVSALLTTPPRPAFYALSGATFSSFGIFFLFLLFAAVGLL